MNEKESEIYGRELVYFIGCCTLGPLIGLLFLVAIKMNFILLATVTLTFWALADSNSILAIEVIKYLSTAILIFSLIIRFLGKKVFD